MGWTAYQSVLAVVMVFTGSINTLTTKWADHLEGKGSDGVLRGFEHPFVQALCMFFGEFLCFVVFKIVYCVHHSKQQSNAEEPGLIKGSQDFNAFLFLPPAMCDMIGTSLMYIGLNLTNPSSFQMLRGSVIVFVALLSVAFLQRKISWQQWLGIFLVLVGLVVVGVSDYLINKSQSSGNLNNTLIGDFIIIGAQVITAAQMVYEEKYVARRDIPALQAVGWEGIFGFIVLAILQIPFFYIVVPHPFSNNAHNALEDFPDAMYQCWDNKLIIVSLVGTIISIAFFNFAGISVTKELSATTRMILDSVRTLFIWGFSLIVRWQKFHPLQILGFALLILGMCIYNNLLSLRNPFASLMSLFRRESREELIQSEDPS